MNSSCTTFVPLTIILLDIYHIVNNKVHFIKYLINS